MSDLTPVIETMEHRWMRAWVNRDVKALKAITARDFILLTGSNPRRSSTAELARGLRPSVTS